MHKCSFIIKSYYFVLFFSSPVILSRTMADSIIFWVRFLLLPKSDRFYIIIMHIYILDIIYFLHIMDLFDMSVSSQGHFVNIALGQSYK